MTDVPSPYDPLSLRGTEFPNRLWMSPMCQYSAEDGLPGDWHLVHYGARATGGAGLAMVEATGVTPEGRISPGDSGLWSPAHASAHARVVEVVHAAGAKAGVQLAHAGRKGSAHAPWNGGGALGPDEGAWTTLAPSEIAFGRLSTPKAMTEADLDAAVEAFASAARLADLAGYDVVEVHAAHGYLLHQFLSPLANRRKDAYGQDRTLFPLRVVRAVRAAWPADKPLMLRLSATDWMPDGAGVEDAIAFAKACAAEGVDLFDVTSGALVPEAKIEVGPMYQAGFASQVREAAGVPVAAVGMIDTVGNAAKVLESGVDAVFLGRPLLRDPYLPLRGAAGDGRDPGSWPVQYHRAL